jgi:photosystem II stability/assembly factor-like uncharacterized protein
MRCLRKQPAERYASAEELADELRRFSQEAPADAGDRLSPARRRSRRLILACVGLVGLASLVLIGLWSANGLRDREKKGNGEPGKPTWGTVAIAPGEERFDRIAFPTEAIGFAASERAVFKTTDAGRTWGPVHRSAAPRRVHLLHFRDEANGWLGADKLYRTTDGGVSWSAADVPGLLAPRVLAAGEGGLLLLGGTSGAAPGELALFRRRGQGPWQQIDPHRGGRHGGRAAPYRHWCLADLSIQGKRQVLAAVFNAGEGGGAILRSSDAGTTWTTVLADVPDVYGVRFSDAGQAWATGAGGRLWFSPDGGRGTTWKEQPNPGGATAGRLAFDPRSGIGFASLGGGQVLLFSGQQATVESSGLEDPVSDVVVTSRGRAFLLGVDGRIARRTVP